MSKISSSYLLVINIFCTPVPCRGRGRKGVLVIKIIGNKLLYLSIKYCEKEEYTVLVGLRPGREDVLIGREGVIHFLSRYM
jgi:hypothetical protein